MEVEASQRPASASWKAKQEWAWAPSVSSAQPLPHGAATQRVDRTCKSQSTEQMNAHRGTPTHSPSNPSTQSAHAGSIDRTCGGTFNVGNHVVEYMVGQPNMTHEGCIWYCEAGGRPVRSA